MCRAGGVLWCVCRAGGNYVPRRRFVWCVCRSRFVLMGHRSYRLIVNSRVIMTLIKPVGALEGFQKVRCVFVESVAQQHGGAKHRWGLGMGGGYFFLN